MRVPAICSKCGTIFPSPIEAENSTISFQNTKLGSCPTCEEAGYFPDGTFEFVGDTIKLLSGSQRTLEELKSLASILKKAQENNHSRKEITSNLQREVPELSSISDALPETRNELYAFLAIILSAITLVTAQFSNSDRTTIEVENVIQNIYESSPSKPIIRKNKIGRNEKCPCNSGLKYKKCCLLKT